MINTLDLFSGIGGFSYGLRQTGGFKTVAYCEIEEYAQEVLLRRMQDGQLDSAPIHTDITQLDGRPLRGHVDLICGGFPCQDLSVAGKQAGIDGERSGLWGEYARLIRQIRPRYVLVENVPGLLVYPGMSRVCGDMAASGYDAEWSCISAAEMGAPHKRDRVWLIGELADSESDGSERILRNLEDPNGIENRSEIEGKIQAGQSRRCCTTSEETEDVADSARNRTQRSADVNREETEGDGPRTPFGGSKNVADSDRNNQRAGKRPEQSTGHPSGERPSNSSDELADSDCTPGRSERGTSKAVHGSQKFEQSGRCSGASSEGVWSAKCRLGRTPDGLPDGVDPDHECLGWECGVPRVAKGQKFRTKRLMGLGNAIVPQISAYLGYLILEMKKNS